MKVRTAFEFDDVTLRTVRAAHGRGGKATRKECVTFIDRAVRAALRAAPDPKPARRRTEPPVAPMAVEPAPPEDDAAVARRNRERIERKFGHGRFASAAN